MTGLSFRINPSGTGSSNVMLDYKLVNNGSNNSTLYWTFNSSSGFNDRMSLTSGGLLTVTSTVVSSDGFQGRFYRVREASANRGGLYPYNLVVGSGSDYALGIFSEGEIFLASGGSATKRFTMNNSGAATFSSSVTATGFFNSSDIRLKDLTNYEYNISAIKPITYFWKDGRDNKKHLGYSAQEVQKVMPDAVNEDTNGFLSVNYIEILVAKIEMLEKEIKLLKII
jgi:hypothetical protein